MPSKTKKTGSKKGVVPEHDLFEEHAGHGNHLCELVARRRMARVAREAKGARFVCHICGRAAKKKGALCEPVEI